jgi:phosphopentomutase
MFQRIVFIVLDSVGIGALPDAQAYGDEGANTLAHIAAAAGGLHIPHMAKLGIGKIHPLPGVDTRDVKGAYGKMAERSAGKDTTNGHWEFVGVCLERPLPTYPNGFPEEIIRPFERLIGRSVLGNRPASGTEIIAELGDLHVQTGCPIVYTSADSVFQIAAHEEVIPLPELYRMCEIARSLLTGEHAVGRVIARPFIGKNGTYVRTSNRRDYSLHFGRTVLNELADASIDVVGIGKVEDIYGGSGITRGIHTRGNMDGVDQTIDALQWLERGLLFTNLVDFDMLYGHRNDPLGFAGAVEAFDARLPEIYASMTRHDLLIISADHGCDPTTPGTDHSREYVPLLVYHKEMEEGVNLGTRATFADVGATIAENFGVRAPEIGTSFLKDIARNGGQ